MWKFFANPWALWLLALVPLLWLSSMFAGRRKRRAAIQFGGLFSKATTNVTARRTKSVLVYAALVLLLIGMAGPQWGRDKSFATTKGQDLTIVLDMSLSMAAEQPSRFERARRLLNNLIDELQQRGGTRVALVLFSARAEIASPLTLDYNHFRWLLAKRDPKNRSKKIRPPRGEPTGPSGTRIGAAIRLAVNMRDDRYPKAHNILLVSDGDDPGGDHEWFEGVRVAQKLNGQVDVLAVGDTQPHTIPLGSGVVEYDGKPVQTQLNPSLLQEIARRTDGEYIEAGTQRLELGPYYSQILRGRQQREGTPSDVIIYKQRYYWFLGGALLVWIVALILPEGKRWKPSKKPQPSR